MGKKWDKNWFCREGYPRICVPLTGNGMPALLLEMKEVQALPADFFEWRADCFFGDPLTAVPSLQEALGDSPLLFTLRTTGEGGQRDCTPEEYEEQVLALLESGGCDLLDIELSAGEQRVQRLIGRAREKGVLTVVSQHNFERTPPEERLIATLETMHGLGADFPKVAVMPQNPRDVLTLLAATLEVSSRLGPVITMAMGELGRISRVAGGLVGSCITFGAGSRASAPGQLGAEDLSAILRDVAPSLERNNSDEK